MAAFTEKASFAKNNNHTRLLCGVALAEFFVIWILSSPIVYLSTVTKSNDDPQRISVSAYELVQKKLETCINSSATAILPLHNRVREVTEKLELCIMESKKEESTRRASTYDTPNACNTHFLRECAQNLWTYENPLSDFPQSSAALQRFAMIPENVIDWRISEQLNLWQDLKKWKTSYDRFSPFTENGMVPIEDDYLLYAMIMTFRPTTILEVGSGHSTRTAHNALLQISKDDTTVNKGQEANLLNRGAEERHSHVCIEPFRSDVIDTTTDQTIPIRVLKQLVQDVDPGEFSKLKKNDILFIDSSHVIKPFGDTILELVFILPTLPVGVIVHIHDVCLPQNYPPEWLSSGSSKSEYTEQYMLASFLYGNKYWKVLWSNWKMAMDHPDVFREIGLPGERHGSIWLLRVA